MKTKIKAGIAVAATVTTIRGGYLYAQEADRPLNPGHIGQAELDITLNPRSEHYFKLAEAYQKVPDTSYATTEVAVSAIRKAQNGQIPVSVEIVQMMQNQKLIEQNAEIIRLLKERNSNAE